MGLEELEGGDSDSEDDDGMSPYYSINAFGRQADFQDQKLDLPRPRLWNTTTKTA
jgi:hypothetical protein